MNIGKIIKEHRKENDLTQEQLAQQFFVTRQLVSKWETGKSYPDLDQVVKLSEFFDLPLDYLLKDDQEMVSELTFDTKKKKWLKRLLLFLGILSISLTTVLVLIFWVDGALLDANDIVITKIEKTVLPEKTITLDITDERITLPTDVSYTIYFETTKPFVKLAKRSGLINGRDETGIGLLLFGEYTLFSSNKKSKIVIPSQREVQLNPDLNIGKNIYLQNKKKLRDSASNNFYEAKNTGTLLFSAEELNHLPNTPEKN
ncbi:helix-turn-helix domain-containing protein [Enterococcus massiliensis]|uniref:helix-turn-helix domain-containing protein n=1 Tax=Enterococcus massiliensis TaxID=1640685 RepID=UPI00065E01CA|nr:helix-turn-helix transcriptional regulator [Enterococcus massiliensis]